MQNILTKDINLRAKAMFWSSNSTDVEVEGLSVTVSIKKITISYTDTYFLLINRAFSQNLCIVFWSKSSLYN